MEHSTRTPVLLVFTLILLLTAGGESQASTIDLADLPGVEKRLVEVTFPDQDKVAVRKEIKLITDTLKSTPTAKRSTALRTLADETGWGTLERAVTYYVCAWYGVNYERCRDYLLNSFFWYERGHDRKGKPPQFNWWEMTPWLLYPVYERNKDTKLLHDLIAGRSDGAGATVLYSIRVKACTDHPRGVLEASALSDQALHEVACHVAHGFSPHLTSEKEGSMAHKNLTACIRKAANDPEDPLNKTATRLLREAELLKKYGKPWSLLPRLIPLAADCCSRAIWGRITSIA